MAGISKEVSNPSYPVRVTASEYTSDVILKRSRLVSNLKPSTTIVSAFAGSIGDKAATADNVRVIFVNVFIGRMLSFDFNVSGDLSPFSENPNPVEPVEKAVAEDSCVLRESIYWQKSPERLRCFKIRKSFWNFKIKLKIVWKC